MEERSDPMEETRAELDLMFTNMVENAVEIAEKSGSQLNMILIDAIVNAAIQARRVSQSPTNKKSYPFTEVE
jgi:hypothetical protein